MKKMIMVLSLGALLAIPSYGSGVMEEIEDGILELQLEIDSYCHGRYEQNLAALAEHVVLYIDGTYNTADLEDEMSTLHISVIADNIYCTRSDKRNPNAARERRLRSNYEDARSDIKAGLENGKSRFYYAKIFAGYGLKSLFDFILP